MWRAWKLPRSKCIANVLVCQLCWTFLLWYGKILVKNCTKNLPHSHLAHSLGMTPCKFLTVIPCQKLESWSYQMVYTSQSCFRSARHNTGMWQTDGRTDTSLSQRRISRKRCLRSNPCLVLGEGYRGRRIESHNLRSNEIQDGCWRRSCVCKNCHNFPTGLPIDVMFGSMVGLSTELSFLP